MKEKIVVVEDDAGTASVIRSVLIKHGYQVFVASTSEEALPLIADENPCVLISDIQLPGISGVRLVEILRQEASTARLPIILLTVLGKDADKVQGLRGGADDYLVKPFSPDELAARVQALIRRSRPDEGFIDVLAYKKMTLDMKKREVRVAGRIINLRKKEYELLLLFMKKKNHVLTRDYIVAHLWNDEIIVTDNALNAHVKNLRNQITPYGACIQTLKGQGYKFFTE